MKCCSRCGELKSFEFFPKKKENKDGYHSHCKQCRAAYDKSRYSSQGRSEAYYADLEDQRKLRREYYSKNKQGYYSRKAKRRAELLNRTPKWLSEHDKLHIDCIYSVCSMLNKEGTGPYEVDHIVPLQGENVSGLHVPWNLRIITRTENRSKGNKYDYNLHQR
jgi:5-methylcytosine-specific restriction endonuclease McrA